MNTDASRLTAAVDAVTEVLEAVGNLSAEWHDAAELERAVAIIAHDRLLCDNMPNDTPSLLAWVAARAALSALMRAQPALYERALALLPDVN